MSPNIKNRIGPHRKISSNSAIYSKHSGKISSMAKPNIFKPNADSSAIGETYFKTYCFPDIHSLDQRILRVDDPSFAQSFF